MQPFAHVTFPIQIVTATEKLRYSFSYPVGEYPHKSHGTPTSRYISLPNEHLIFFSFPR